MNQNCQNLKEEYKKLLTNKSIFLELLSKIDKSNIKKLIDLSKKIKENIKIIKDIACNEFKKERKEYKEFLQ